MPQKQLLNILTRSDNVIKASSVRLLWVAAMELIYYFLRISKLVLICIIPLIITVQVAPLDIVLQTSSVTPRVQDIINSVLLSFIDNDRSRRFLVLARQWVCSIGPQVLGTEHWINLHR